jgi:beta-glucosidase/6-phospho-beta-glucosidase/beta-galactosidase
MARLGIKHYRLSISWGRILPEGRTGTRVNAEGVAFYNK